MTITIALIELFVALLVWGVILVVVKERTKTRRHQVDMAHLCFLHENVYKALDEGRVEEAIGWREVATAHWRNIASDNA